MNPGDFAFAERGKGREGEGGDADGGVVALSWEILIRKQENTKKKEKRKENGGMHLGD